MRQSNRAPSFGSHGLLITLPDSLFARYGAWDPLRGPGCFLLWHDVRLEGLGADAVFALALIEVGRPERARAVADTLHGTWTGVFERRAGRWSLAHEHESFAQRSAR
jgi:hypothetical protein